MTKRGYSNLKASRYLHKKNYLKDGKTKNTVPIQKLLEHRDPWDEIKVKK